MKNEFNEFSGSLYIPPNQPDETKCENATAGFKFCKDVFVNQSVLDQFNIPYLEEDLEDGLIGRGVRIKRDKKENEDGDVLCL